MNESTASSLAHPFRSCLGMTVSPPGFTMCPFLDSFSQSFNSGVHPNSPRTSLNMRMPSVPPHLQNQSLEAGHGRQHSQLVQEALRMGRGWDLLPLCGETSDPATVRKGDSSQLVRSIPSLGPVSTPPLRRPVPKAAASRVPWSMLAPSALGPAPPVCEKGVEAGWPEGQADRCQHSASDNVMCTARRQVGPRCF